MKLRLGLLVALSAALAMAGCSSSDCEETRTCAGSGDAGTVGKACETNPDCDDGLACNGEEQCIAKKCQAGTPACTTSDPDHCEATCKESSGGPVCGEQGRDADGDTHRAALCAENPGDDCDDAHDTAYPGASEVCDGFDNDCNGKTDTEDGLSLFGVMSAVADPDPGVTLTAPAIVWAPEVERFGVVFTADDGTASRPGFRQLSSAGTPDLSPTYLVTTTPSKVGFARIAWNGTNFGVVWDDSTSGNSDIRFVTVEPTGAVGTLRTLTTSPDDEIIPSVAAVGKRWIVSWQREVSATDHELSAIMLDADGTPTTASPTVIAPTVSGVGIARVAGRSGQALMAWSQGTTSSSISFTLLNDALVSQGKGTWGGNGGTSFDRFVQVAAVSSGDWLGAWQSGPAGSKQVTVGSLSGAGAKGCSEAVADGTDYVGPAAVVGQGATSVVAVADGTGDAASLRVVTVGADCERIQSAEVTKTAYSPGQAPEAVGDLAASDQAIGVVWSERLAGVGHIRGRFVGPALCDAPK